ncbi:hypothetical protein F5144DRAFT_316504 [Chaetomium tenue]|jgi:dynein light chain roadblock-type|uniref:Roadblock/LAMTOR2 domain-containing protein n=2 Tax=Chaetomium TaxID=5149 RepID=Q2H4C2_CHAGB|nr:uncharacterized protein CHGG_06493 [Chaetomium globosum CBS 148.51]EAQ89874.1 hypothetical protein CHGG_06493 [Chaetomium globosum CBS 148.51]KAH6628589.1 hypothetical protein F5144DRAFT_316504 [Chaetomium globosum]
MSDAALGTGPDALEETLGRLSKKAGVRATIALDRASGAILKTSGQVGSIRTAKPSGSSVPAAGSFANESDGGSANHDQGTEELASMVWNFVNTAGGLVQELDTEDEVKLLRLRTKKQEFVIVPDAKYLLIVIHDTAA